MRAKATTTPDATAAARGWFRVPVAIVAKLPTLGHLAVAVYLVLCDRANETGMSWPAVDTIAEQIGAKRRAVQYALSELKNAGLIGIESGTNNSGRRTSNRYIVLDAITNGRDAPKCTDAPGCTGTMHQDAPPRVHVDARGRVHQDAQEQEPVLNKTQRNKTQGNNDAARGKRSAVATEILEGLKIPEELSSDEPRQAIQDWLEHKDRIRNQYVSAKSFQVELKRWAKLGAPRFVAAVIYSIGKEWKGIYEEETRNGHARKAEASGDHKESIAERMKRETEEKRREFSEFINAALEPES
jgi:hypothetical protein